MSSALSDAERVETLVNLSHEFSGPEYVLGGGGNTSCKNEQTLWVKPSGTTLGEMTPERFVQIDRAKLAKLYLAEAPEEPAARETLVKRMAAEAVRPDSKGRPSVEAPLHDSLSAMFVVHLHPPWVNGMTCGADGAAACSRLFPGALWVPFTDPGYALCMRIRREIATYKAQHGIEPAVIFLENHGVFVSADTAQEIRTSYTRMMDTLGGVYRQQGVATQLKIGPAPAVSAADAVGAAWQAAAGSGALPEVVSDGPFEVAAGALTPDHIVYARARVFRGEPSVAAFEAFRDETGYLPRIVATREGVFGIDDTRKRAETALALARDGALVQQLAAAFGGVHYMDARAVDFIENWEVESYRREVSAV